MTSPAVVVTQLSKTYSPSPLWLRVLLKTQVRRPVVALDGVTMTVPTGSICVVAGPNGAGKSTLFRCLAGLVVPTAGAASVLGFDSARQSRQVRGVIGFASGDERSLWLRQSCEDNVGFHARLRGVSRADRPARIRTALAAVGLADAADRSGFALSGGMRARLQLACTLVGSPAVVVLDEPTAALDPVGAHDLIGLIRRLAEEREIAVILSTHRVDEIEALSQRLVLLRSGRVVHDGPVGGLTGGDEAVVEWRFTSIEAARWAATRLTALPDTAVQSEGSTVTITSTWTLGALLQVLGDRLDTLESVQRQRRPLREVLVDLLRDPVGTDRRGDGTTRHGDLGAA